MDVMTAIRERRSVRSYSDRPVEEEKLMTVLEAARLAPSASNRQEWRLVVVRDPATRRELARIAGQSFIGDAPVVIACCAETDHYVMRCGQKSYPIDVAIAINQMTLAAIELGLGTCWIGAFDEPAARKLLGIPDEIPIVELLPLGYPADSPRPKNRLPLDRIVHWEKW